MSSGKPGLVFTLKVGQSFYIGNPDVSCTLDRPAKVTIELVEGNHVRVRTDAPKKVPVNREGIYKNVDRDQDLDNCSNPDRSSK